MNKSYKLNTIALAEHHKKYCKDSSCFVSLYLLMQMAEEAGVEFTAKERETYFI